MAMKKRMVTKKQKQAVIDAAENVRKMAYDLFNGTFAGVSDAMVDFRVRANFAAKTKLPVKKESSEGEAFDAEALKNNWRDIQRSIEHAEARVREAEAHINRAQVVAESIIEDVGSVEEK